MKSTHNSPRLLSTLLIAASLLAPCAHAALSASASASNNAPLVNQSVNFTGVSSGSGIYTETGGIVTIEAENYDTLVAGTGTLTFPTTNANDAIFYGSFLKVAEPATQNPGIGVGTTYKINFSTVGVYRVLLRRMIGAVDGTQNSIFCYLDGVQVTGASTNGCINNVDVVLNNRWYWPADNTNGNLNITTAGVHTIQFLAREDNYALDRVVLDSTNTFTPTNPNGATPASRGPDESKTWLWDFGDGQSSTVQSPSHAYTTTGTKNVKLTVNDGVNPPAISNIVVTVNAVFIAPPTASPGSTTVYNKVRVTLSGPAGSTIYYSTDGNDPVVGQANTTQYSAPIPLTTTTTLKAIAKVGADVSTVFSAVYTIRPVLTLEPISMNFVANQAFGGGGGTQNTSTALLSSETTGIVPKSNWNNSSGSTGTLPTVVDGAGVSISALSITWAANNTWSDGNDSTPINKLFNGYLDDPHIRASIFNVPFLRYDIYVYSHGDAADTTMQGRYWVDNVEHFFNDAGFKMCQNSINSQLFVVSDGNGGPGNVLLWPNLSFGTVVISADDNNRTTGFRSPLNAFQIVSKDTVITSLSPVGGKVLGGDTIQVTGVNFAPGATFFIDGIACPTNTINSTTSYTIVTPQHTGTGVFDVLYVDASNQFTLPNSFQYAATNPPIVSSLSPAFGPVTAPRPQVTINGANFQTGATVKFGSANAVAANFVSATQLNQINVPDPVPPGTAGLVDVIVTNTDGGFGKKIGGYYYSPGPLSITSITPQSGPTTAGTFVHIVGANFQLPMTITVGSTPVTTFINTNTTIDFSMPAGANGASTITVTTTGDVQSKTIQYTFLATPVSPLPYAPTPFPIVTHYFNDTITLTYDGTPYPATSKFYFTINGSTPSTNLTPWDATTNPLTLNSTGPAAIIVKTIVGYLDGHSDVGSVSYTPFRAAPVAAGFVGTNGNLNYKYYEPGGNDFPAVPPANPTKAGVISAANGGTLAGTGSQTTTNPPLTVGTNYGNLLNIRNTGDTGNSFNADYTGLLVVDNSSIVTLNTNSDDGSILYIDGVLIVNNSGGHGTQDAQGQIGLKAGGHNLRVTFGNGNGGIGLTLKWDPTGGNNINFIPNPNLSLQGTISTTISRPSGNFGGSKLRPVTITATTSLPGPAPTIYYTLDGSDPDPAIINSTAITYTGPIANISGTTIVQYMAKAAGFADSPKNSVIYALANPVVTSVAPSSGPPGSPTHVTITGENFSLPGALAKVTFGSLASNPAPSATNVVFVSDTQITCDVPLADPSFGGNYPATAACTVINDNGDSGQNASAFTYTGPPTVTQVSPNTGSSLGGEQATLTGTNFVSGSTVSVGGNLAPQALVFFIDNNTITFITPPSSTPGAKDVKVTTPDGRFAVLAASYTYVMAPAPAITSISQPDFGPLAGGTSIIVNGNNFVAGATVKLGNVVISNPFINSNLVGFTTPVSATFGARDISIINVDSQTAVRANAFTYLPDQPVISVNFRSATDNGGSAAINANEVTGVVPVANWNNASGPNGSMPLVLHSGASAGSTVTWSANNNWTDGNDNTPIEKLFHGYLDDSAGTTATITNVPSTRYDVYVYSHGDAGDNALQGEYFADSAAHALGQAGNKTCAQVGGSNPAFILSDGAGSRGNYIVFNSLTSSTLVVGGRKQGGTRAPFNGFQIVSTAPQIAAVFPGTGLINTTTNITIKGTGFAAGATVTVGSTAATNVVVVDANTITATTPALGVGNYAVTVTTGGVPVSMANAFAYQGPAPVIESITPTTGGTVGGTIFAIVGQNFLGPLQVKFGNNFVTSPTVDTEPGTGKPRINGKVPPSTTTGSVVVTVINNDLQQVTTSFTYTQSPAPLNLSIVPQAGPENVNANVVINGINFATTAGSPPGSQVSVAGAAAVSNTATSSTTINATLPGQAAGQKNIVVTNPDGQTVSLVNGFTYLAQPALNPYVSTTGTGPINHFFNPASGVDVTLTTTAPAGAKIYYTLNGATPTTTLSATNLLWDPAAPPAPIHVSIASTIKAIVSYLDGISAVNTGNYAPMYASVTNATLNTARLNCTYYNTGAPVAATFPAGLSIAADTVVVAQSSAPLCGIGTAAQNAAQGMLLNNAPAQFGASGALTNFSVRFKGFVDCPVTGVYSFDTATDDGSRLYIDGILVVNNNFGAGQGVTDNFGQIGLLAGKHAITIDYFQGGGGYSISVKWQTPAGGPSPSALNIIGDPSIGVIPPPVITTVNPAASITTTPGQTVVVTGSGFQTGATISIGGVLLTNFVYDLTNPNAQTITATTPANLIANPTSLVVTNPDTGTASVVYTVFRAADIPLSTTNLLNQVAYSFYGAGNGGQLLPGTVTRGDATPVTAMDALVATNSGRYTGGQFTPQFICSGPTQANNVGNGNLLAARMVGVNFWAKFTAYLQVPVDGVYTFTTSSDDATALFFGSQQVVNNNFDQGVTDRSGSITLKAGRHAMTMMFGQGGGGFGMAVQYSGPGIALQIIPDSVLLLYARPDQVAANNTSNGSTIFANTGGEPMSITNSGASGTGFTPGSTLTIGGVSYAANEYTVSLDGQTITLTTKPTPAGSASIVITGPDGQTKTLTNAVTFTGQDPVFISVDKSSGPDYGGQTLTINGANFSGSTVKFVNAGNAPAYKIVSVTPTQIVLLTPQVTTGGTALPTKILITNGDNKINDVNAAVQTPPPYTFDPALDLACTVTGASGTSPALGGGTITVTGTKFGLTAKITIGGNGTTPATLAISNLIDDQHVQFAALPESTLGTLPGPHQAAVQAQNFTAAGTGLGTPNPAPANFATAGYTYTYRTPVTIAGEYTNAMRVKFWTAFGPGGVMPANIDAQFGAPNSIFYVDDTNLTSAPQPVQTSGNMLLHLPNVVCTARFEGFVKIDVDGIYSFATGSDDGSRLYIGTGVDQTLLVLNNNSQGKTFRADLDGSTNYVNPSVIALGAGFHPLTIEWSNGGGGYDLQVQWKLPGAATFVDIPDDHIVVDTPPPASITGLRIDTVAPSSGPNTGGTVVTFSGHFFNINPAMTTTVTFGAAAPVNAAPVTNSKSFTVTTVAHSAGSFAITVNTPGRSVLSPINFQFDGGPTTWLGAASIDWNNAANWDNGVPGTNSQVFLTGNGTFRPTNQNIPTPLVLSSLTINGGTDTNGYTVTGNAISLSSITTSLAQAAGTGPIVLGLDIALPNNADWNINGSLVVNGVVSGNGFNKTGTGGLTLANSANSYAGATSVTAGSLSVSAVSNGGTNGPLGSASSAPANFVLNGGKLVYTGAAGSTNRGVSINANSTIELSGGPLTLAGVIAGTGKLTKIGAGQLVLGNSNTWSGGISLDAGEIVIKSNNATGTGVTAVNNATDVLFDNGSNYALTGGFVLNSTNVLGAMISTDGIHTITGTMNFVQPGIISVAAGSISVTGKVSGGNLTKIGAGELVFLSSQNNYGNSDILAGKLTGGVGGSLSNGTVTINGATLGVGAQNTPGLIAKFYSVTPQNVNNANPDVATLATLDAFSLANTPTLTINTTAGGKADFNYSNLANQNNAPFNQNLADTANYGFGNNVNYVVRFDGLFNAVTAGAYLFTTTSDDGSVVFIDGAKIVDNNFYQGQTARNGTATLTAGLHAITICFYQGTGGQGLWVQVTPPGGAIRTLTNNDVLNTLSGGNYPNTVVVAAFPAQIESGTLAASFGAMTINVAGTLKVLPAAFRPNANYSVGMQTMQISTDVTIDVASNGTGTGLFSAGGIFDFSPTAHAVTKTNTGTFAISGNSLVSDNALLKVSGGIVDLSNNALGSSTDVTLSAGTTLNIRADNTAASINGPGNIAFIDGPAKLTIGTASNHDSAISAAISDPGAAKAGSLAKAGTGTLTLSGANTYIGTTTINAGTTLVTSSGKIAAASAVSVDNGAVLFYNASTPSPAVTLKNTSGIAPATPALAGTRLRGTGTVGALAAGDVSGNANAVVWPGTVDFVSGLSANQVLTASSTSLLGGGKLAVLVNSATGFCQKLSTGTLSIDANSVLSFGTTGSVNSNEFIIVDTGGVTGITTAFNPAKIQAGLLSYNTDYDVIYRDTITPSADIISPASNATTLAHSVNRILVKFKSTNVTPVKIDAFTARAEGAGVVAEWTAVSEFKNAGFNLLRSDLAGAGEWVKVNPALISGRITNPDAKIYSFYDWAPSGSYAYKLESVGVRGESEFFFPSSSAVSLDWSEPSAAVTSDAIESAGNTVALSGSVREASDVAARFEQLSAKGAAAPSAVERIEQSARSAATAQVREAIAPAEGQAFAERKPTMAAREINAAQAVAANAQPGAARAGVRWFSPVKSGGAAGFAAAKVVYGPKGVMFIPQSLLPAGFDVNHVSLQREGRNFPALALVNGGLLVYGPGYQDDYTDKDAIFLRRIGGATTAGQATPASGLFTSGLPVNVTTAATATTDFHDVYFDFNLRPYSFTPWFSSKYLAQGTTQTFTLDTPLAAGGPATLTINLWSLTSDDAANPDHGLMVTVNGQDVGQQFWDGGNSMMQFTFNIPASVLLSGTNEIKLTTPSIPNQENQTAFLHSMSMNYTRLLDGSKPVEVVNASSGASLFELNNIPSGGAWVVDTRFTDRAALVASEVATAADGSRRLRFTATNGVGGRYLVVPVGQENAPLGVSQRQVRPVRLAGTYMAVGPSQFAAGTQPLLMAHSREGIRGAYVDQEQLFDYYHFGRFGPDAIRSAVRAIRPQYLLLVGRTTYDYRNYGGLNVDPLCPTYLVTTSFWSQTTSDSAFGDLGRGVPDIAIGRLPVNNTAELTGAVGRITGYRGLPVSGVRFHAVADLVDADAGDFAAEAESLRAANPSFSWQENYQGITFQTSPEVTAAMTEAANGGADIIYYTGHGNSTHLGKFDPRILDLASLAEWKGNVVFLQSTCTANWMAKNQTGFQSIAIQGLTQPQGGICANIGSSTYVNSEATTAFMAQLLKNVQSGGKMRWGTALLRAQQWAYSQGVSNVNYSDLGLTEQIFGDPAMNVYSPPARPGNNGGNGGSTVPGGGSAAQPGTF